MKSFPLPGIFPCAILGTSLFCISYSFAQNPNDIKYYPEKAKTIPGHGMSKAEYPYDEGGKYRTEWVNTQARSATKYSVTVKKPIPRSSEEHSSYLLTQRARKAAAKKLAETEDRRRKSEAKRQPPQKPVVAYNPYGSSGHSEIPKAKVASRSTGGYIGPYQKMQKNGTPPVQQFRKPAPAPSKPKPAPTVAYHRVDVGDTLYNISRKYGVSVEALKKINGLTSDLIRVGQSLRLVLAQHSLGLPRS